MISYTRDIASDSACEHTGGQKLATAIGDSISQVEAAKRLNISAPFLNQLVNGVRNPSLKLALRIDEIYSVPPSAWHLKEDLPNGK